MSLFFRVAYLVGFKPWDSGRPPPELVEYVEGPSRLPPGRALDLGCGTGTNVVYLARNGWEATGVDVVGRAISQARRKVSAAGVQARLVRGDVTRLDELDVDGGYRLLLDQGCFHSIPEPRRDAYVRGVTRAAEGDAVFLMFGFVPGAMGVIPGVSEAELRERLADGWVLEDATRGTDRIESWWYRMRRRP
jgi:SAM-dependent methyltransferase